MCNILSKEHIINKWKNTKVCYSRIRIVNIIEQLTNVNFTSIAIICHLFFFILVLYTSSINYTQQRYKTDAEKARLWRKMSIFLQPKISVCRQKYLLKVQKCKYTQGKKGLQITKIWTNQNLTFHFHISCSIFV